MNTTKLAVMLVFLGTMLSIGIDPAPGLATSILGTAENFAVLAGSGIVNTGLTTITGNVGSHPTGTITGQGPGVDQINLTGTYHAGDGTALTAKNDLSTAYTDLAGRAVTGNLTGQDLGGLTLTPGVYHFDTTALLTGTLTLDAQENNNALWVFQIGTALTTASNSQVQVINSGSPLSVYWQIGSSATLGTGTAFQGNILALTSITLNTDATILNGRVLALNGAVTLDTNNISIAPVPGPSTFLLFGPAIAGLALLRRRFLN